MNNFENANLARDLGPNFKNRESFKSYNIQDSKKKNTQETETQKYLRWEKHLALVEEASKNYGREDKAFFEKLSNIEQLKFLLNKYKDLLEEKRVDFLQKTGVDINDLTLQGRLDFFWVYNGYDYESCDDTSLKLSTDKFNKYIKKYGKDALETILSDYDFMFQVVEHGDVEKIEEMMQDKEIGKRFYKIFSGMFSMAEETDIIVDELNKIFKDVSGKIFFNKDWRTHIEDAMTIFFVYYNDDLSNNRLLDGLESAHENFHGLKEALESLKIFYKNTASDWDNFEYKENALKTKEFLDHKVKIFKEIEELKLRGIEIPDNFYKDVSDSIDGYTPELSSMSKKPYLPIGISSDSIFADEKIGNINTKEDSYVEYGNASKLDFFSYLLWLNNQNIKSDFYIIDSIQEKNYELLHGLDKERAIDIANKEGLFDYKMYNNYKDVFNLDNIDIAGFSKIKQSEDFQRERSYIADKILHDDFFKKIFESLIEPSIFNKALQKNPQLDKSSILESLREYVEQEVAMIISKRDGIKIGHEKERKYDMLAKTLSIYKTLESNIEEVKSIILRSDNKNKYNPKNISDFDMQLRNLSIQILSSMEFSEQYKKYLNILSDLETDFEVESDKVKKISIRLNDLEKDIQQNELIISNNSAFEKDLKDLVNKKLKTKSDILVNLSKELEESGNKLEELKLTIEEHKKLIESYLNYNSEDRDTGAILNKFRMNGFYKWSKEHILNAYSNIGEKIIRQDWFHKSEIPQAYYPKGITSKSFINDLESPEERIGFREPYGTKRYKNFMGFGGYLPPTDINQIFVDSEGRLVGDSKLLCLREEKQLEYLNKNIVPFLIEYYINSFKNKELAKEKFIEDFHDAKTFSDIFNLIENKIILLHYPKQSQK